MMNVGTLISAMLAFGFSLSGTTAVAQTCQLCVPAPPGAKAPLRPLTVAIDTTLDFSTAAHTDRGAGSITIDAGTGRRQLIGLISLGGPALVGTVTITGEPFARVVVDLPNSIVLNSNLGAIADVTQIRSDLPPHPTIGQDGRLVFTFGGRLTVRDEAAGEFRGRIPITADYE
jgi:hypothetical protein